MEYSLVKATHSFHMVNRDLNSQSAYKLTQIITTCSLKYILPLASALTSDTQLFRVEPNIKGTVLRKTAMNPGLGKMICGSHSKEQEKIILGRTAELA